MYAIVQTWLCVYVKRQKDSINFTNSVDPDETPGSALFAMFSTFLVMVDNI